MLNNSFVKANILTNLADVLCIKTFHAVINKPTTIAVSVSQALRENTYPFLALVVLRDNRMTVVAKIEGLIGMWSYSRFSDTCHPTPHTSNSVL